MAGHSPLLIVLTSVNFGMFALALLITFLSIGSENIFGSRIGIFNNSVNSTDRDIEIGPAPQTFSIVWAVIYIWHFIWMFYSFANICRRTTDSRTTDGRSTDSRTTDGPVYANPTLLTPTFFLASILNWCCIITWNIVRVWEHLWVAVSVLACAFIATYICIGLSYKALSEHKDLLIKQGRSREIWMVRMFVQNGLGFYGAWCTIATLLNLATAMIYSDLGPNMGMSKTCTIVLSILAVEVVVFVLTDWTLLDKYSRYTFSPYILVVVALLGIVAENWNPTKTNSIFTVVLLGVAVLCFAVKMILFFVRHCRDSRCNEMVLPTLKKGKF